MTRRQQLLTTAPPDTTAAAVPEQIWGGQGETVWAVYYGYWPESEFTQQAYDSAVGLGSIYYGFEFYGRFDLRCDQGAYELLGLDAAVNYVAVAAYFATEDDAILASHFETDIHPYGQVEVYCAD